MSNKRPQELEPKPRLKPRHLKRERQREAMQQEPAAVTLYPEPEAPRWKPMG